ncbi:hypothetical protein PFISCL1PPCAC_23698 [Pristionchus fissidentatus]|uniref:Peptidase M12B domain-containing protein n=1 Tax=Pristionchus fissidentatus TaxID=1538716 RepID=A0AAV5WJE9_9BILA|nr:hypothetical protein PFISCL1PPCAC_23698 [Pristionchus fissidentatus]
MILLLLLCLCPISSVALVQFFTPDELRYTFGVRELREVPHHTQVIPQLIQRGSELILHVEVDGKVFDLPLEESIDGLHGGKNVAVVRRGLNKSKLSLGMGTRRCHYRSISNQTIAAISTCDGRVKGTIIDESGLHVIHPFPDRHGRSKRSTDNGVHAVYKRAALVPTKDFCGIENVITEEQLVEDDNAIYEDVFVTGQKLTAQSDLIVELAVFVDEQLWRHFSSKYGGAASSKLEDYTLTLLNNIQIMYYQPTASPPLTFRVIRYEVLSSQPSALAPHLHNYGHAQMYLDRFCRYQRNLGVRDWDHAILLTGYDIHRGAGSTSISGIARLDGMCDPWNTCTLAEGLDFTSAFIGTHELGHSLGMRHDEPYCQSKHIMSSSLGPGKVTWSTCSLRDYHQFLQRLDARGKNCMRVSNMGERLRIPTGSKPGQIYDANMQCSLMHGPGYQQVTPRQDSYDGICYMMWCGQSTFGRIITSHPALEGTFCGENKWCQLGRCIPWDGGRTDNSPWMAAPQPTPVQRIDGGWSQWPGKDCDSCQCPNIAGGIGLTVQKRTCTNPAPSNGGSECTGSSARALVCDRSCGPSAYSVDEYISQKCMEHKRFKNDKELTGSGTQLIRFPQRACKVFCDVFNRRGGQRNYRFFGDNLPDGTSCGYDRHCLEGECLPLSCGEEALIGRDQSCPRDSCPMRKAPPPTTTTTTTTQAPARFTTTAPHTTTTSIMLWTEWSAWSVCSVTCGGGYRRRNRACLRGYCGGDSSEEEQCNTDSCPALRNEPPSWSGWTEWNECSVSCGRGSQARYRRCRTEDGTLSFDCSEKNIEVRNCDMGSCTAIGVWGSWAGWSTCSTSCGSGTLTRQRFCQREPCDGSATERQSCNEGSCPAAEGKWTSWNEWSSCSRLCGRGLRSRSRACYEGSCAGLANEQEFCNEESCDQEGEWARWSNWSSCSVSCGAGVKRRTRYCRTGDCPGNYKESAICNEGECSSRNASWGGWGYWSTCSESCGAGVRKRVRKCYGSGSCPGDEYERQYCYNRQC